MFIIVVRPSSMFQSVRADSPSLLLSPKFENYAEVCTALLVLFNVLHGCQFMSWSDVLSSRLGLHVTRKHPDYTYSFTHGFRVFSIESVD